MASMNKDEFARRVLAAEQTLYCVAKTMLECESDCEDAVSEAILKAFENLGSLRNERFFKTWLVRILINECRKKLRERKRTLPAENCGDGEAAAETADYSDLYRAISQLKPKVRAAVVLHYIEEYSVEETAGILKIPKGTVKSRLSEGRKSLRQYLT